MRQELRDYQENAIRRLLAAWRSGARSVLLVSPTGSGKTTIFSYLLQMIAKHALVLVHRRELATQATNRLREFEVPFGFIMAGEPATPYARVQVASIQTLVNRAKPRAVVVVIDEAHLSTAETYRKILEAYPNALILGVTATPWRLGGQPLSSLYDECIVVATPAELREQGHLCDYVGFRYKAPDLEGVGKTGDDYNQGQAGAACMAIVPDVVEQWQKSAAHLSTVVFAATVEHSQKLAEQFRAVGVAAEHLDGSTPIGQRAAILERVERGETRVLCNVGVAVEGLDIPRLKCCVLARPTMSLARAIQMMGRVRRPWRDPRTGEWCVARIHDHAFVIAQHGLPDAERDYQLHAPKAHDVGEAIPSMSTCPECLAMWEGGGACPNCGSAKAKEERELKEILDAERVEFVSGQEVPGVLPPLTQNVDISWNQVGRLIEGLFESTFEKDTQWGKRKIHMVVKTTPKRITRYSLPGTAMLDKLMAKVNAGDGVRVTYEGEEILDPSRSRKKFKVEVERRVTEPDPALVAELRAFYAEHGTGPASARQRQRHPREAALASFQARLQHVAPDLWREIRAPFRIDAPSHDLSGRSIRAAIREKESP